MDIKTNVEIQDWLVSYISDLLEINPDEVDVKTPFDRYGLDSSSVVGLTAELGDWLGKDLNPKLMYDYPTIEVLVDNLVQTI
ncbi:MAG: acyl carrier protein [Symploca sp. SIO1C2]|nr:acyl carrier protein [Symploca sp. SIO1C2]